MLLSIHFCGKVVLWHCKYLVECVQTQQTLCKFFIETMINVQATSHFILPLQHELFSLWFTAVSYKIVTVI